MCKTLRILAKFLPFFKISSHRCHFSYTASYNCNHNFVNFQSSYLFQVSLQRLSLYSNVLFGSKAFGSKLVMFGSKPFDNISKEYYNRNILKNY